MFVVCGACGSSDTAPTVNVPFSSVDLKVGTGATAAAGQTLTVNYTGWLYDASKTDNKGTQFDSSLSAGRTPFQFVLGAGQVIKGWDQGLVGMKIGGSRRLIIPPDLGYGSSGSGPIPPNATLVFDIDLLSAQ
ncbi:MAG TPA: FKBP-type peptidyl-prolyl cis-trans isomerase [Vicinamibacterales bacterium]